MKKRPHSDSHSLSGDHSLLLSLSISFSLFHTLTITPTPTVTFTLALALTFALTDTDTDVSLQPVFEQGLGSGEVGNGGAATPRERTEDN